MILLNDETIIKTITRTLRVSSPIKDTLLDELESYVNIENNEKKEIFTKILLNAGKDYQKKFPNAITSLLEFEKVLFIDSNYRDHFLHTLRVWGLGLLLYDKLFKKYFEEKGIDKDTFCFQWYLAAVYHDIGYPLSKVNKIVNDINKNFDYIGLKFEIKDISSIENKVVSL